MSIEEYQEAIAPKMAGTKNLIESLNDIAFDFFIMLSSCSGLIGLPGQANYAAGNTFQDTIADDRLYSNAHYITVDMAPVEDTDILRSKGVKKALIRAGASPITLESSLRVLEYCMSPKAKQDNCQRLALGFTRESLLNRPNASETLQPLFCQLSTTMEQVSNKTSSNARLNIDTALDTAKNIDEVTMMAATAISTKVSTLISLGHEQISIEYPMGRLGLDSLITIELKNWIAHTFLSQVSSSEIMDSRDIKALAEVVVQRSKRVRLQQDSSNSNQDQVNGTSNELITTIRLPSVPLPNLDDTVNEFIESIRSLCSPEDLITLKKAASQFLSASGKGQELHQRLVSRTKDPLLDDWLYDLYLKDTWLKRRASLNPWRHFFAAIADDGIQHSQARRAAIVATATFQFKDLLESGKLEPDYRDGERVDMHLHEWIFNSYLHPRPECDTVHKLEPISNVIVLRNGHIYEIDGHTSVDRFEAQFKVILDRSHAVIPAVASLTADDRDSWANVSFLYE
jgi:hypothetical protein